MNSVQPFWETDMYVRWMKAFIPGPFILCFFVGSIYFGANFESSGFLLHYPKSYGFLENDEHKHGVLCVHTIIQKSKGNSQAENNHFSLFEDTMGKAGCNYFSYKQ